MLFGAWGGRQGIEAQHMELVSLPFIALHLKMHKSLGHLQNRKETNMQKIVDR